MANFSTATEGEDYVPLVLFPVTIPATEFFTSVALDIIINDTFTETLRENVGLAFNTDLPRIELDPANILTILDDDRKCPTVYSHIMCFV